MHDGISFVYVWLYESDNFIKFIAALFIYFFKFSTDMTFDCM